MYLDKGRNVLESKKRRGSQQTYSNNWKGGEEGEHGDGSVRGIHTRFDQQNPKSIICYFLMKLYQHQIQLY